MGKRTAKREKKIKKENENIANTNKMIEYLKNKWNNDICYTCNNCLREAYLSEISNTTGYVTDEDLIISSKNKLKHK